MNITGSVLLSLFMRPKQNMCVFQVSRPYVGFCPGPEYFIVNCEENIVKLESMLLHQIGPQLKLPIRDNNSIHALSVLQTCLIVSCFGVYGIGPSI